MWECWRYESHWEIFVEINRGGWVVGSCDRINKHYKEITLYQLFLALQNLEKISKKTSTTISSIWNGGFNRPLNKFLSK